MLVLFLLPFVVQLCLGIDSRLGDAGENCVNEPWLTKNISWCLSDQNVIPNEYDTIKSVVRSAFHEWDVTGSGLTFTENSRCNKSDSDITVSFRFNDDPNSANGFFSIYTNTTLAVTFKPPFGTLDVNSNKKFSLWFPGSPGSNDTEKPLLYSVLLHQVGRALGLCYSLEPDDVMYYAYQNNKQALHPNDIRRLIEIYNPTKQ